MEDYILYHWTHFPKIYKVFEIQTGWWKNITFIDIEFEFLNQEGHDIFLGIEFFGFYLYIGFYDTRRI